MSDDFNVTIIGSIVGGIISGAVGLVIVWYTHRGKNEDWLRENVYRKLYNEIFDLNDGKYYSRFIRYSSWNELDNYSKSKIDSELRTLLIQYAYQIQKYDKIVRTKIDYFTSQKANIESILKTAFQKANLIDNNDSVVRYRNNSNYVLDWLIDYSSIFLNSDITDPDMLYKKLEERAIKANDGYLETIQKWKNDNSSIYAYIYEQMSFLKQLHVWYNEDEIEKQRLVLVDITKDVLEKLKKKIG